MQTFREISFFLKKPREIKFCSPIDALSHFQKSNTMKRIYKTTLLSTSRFSIVIYALKLLIVTLSPKSNPARKRRRQSLLLATFHKTQLTEILRLFIHALKTPRMRHQSPFIRLICGRLQESHYVISMRRRTARLSFIVRC